MRNAACSFRAEDGELRPRQERQGGGPHQDGRRCRCSDYHAGKRLLYVASARDGKLTFARVADGGALTKATAPTASGARNPGRRRERNRLRRRFRGREAHRHRTARAMAAARGGKLGRDRAEPCVQRIAQLIARTPAPRVTPIPDCTRSGGMLNLRVGRSAPDRSSIRAGELVMKTISTVCVTVLMLGSVTRGAGRRGFHPSEDANTQAAPVTSAAPNEVPPAPPQQLPPPSPKTAAPTYYMGQLIQAGHRPRLRRSRTGYGFTSGQYEAGSGCRTALSTLTRRRRRASTRLSTFIIRRTVGRG